MFVNDCLNVNEKGHLTIGGCDTVELAKKYGTPLYVLDENVIRSTCKAYVDSFKRHYDGKGLALYASKALSCKALCEIAKEENMGLDVVSGGELYTALKAGFPVENIHF
ncbi:MAG: diaminopimelate decarboxylase, partial [Acutalibacteraceae bacterium]